jgi:sulfur dioxygenase
MVFAQLNTGACKTYLVGSSRTGEAMLVDPLADRVEAYKAELTRRGLKLRYVVDTHVHADHLSGGALLKQQTGAQYLMHKNSVAGCVDQHLEDGETLLLGEVPVQVMHTPGHTQDSVTLRLPDRLLTGDFLFIGEGGGGRTDLPGGDATEHWESLQKMKELPDELLVCPGHDYHGREVSSLAEERRKNPRLVGWPREKYVGWLESQVLGPAEWMKDVIGANYACATDAKGLHIPDDKPACEVSGTKGDAAQVLVRTLGVDEAAMLLDREAPPLVVDVRGPEEFNGELGHIPGAKLLPLNELAHRAAELEPWRSRPVLVVCRSGGRSSTATGLLTAAGFKDVRSVAGGMTAWKQMGLPVERRP